MCSWATAGSVRRKWWETSAVVAGNRAGNASTRRAAAAPGPVPSGRNGRALGQLARGQQRAGVAVLLRRLAPLAGRHRGEEALVDRIELAVEEALDGGEGQPPGLQRPDAGQPVQVVVAVEGDPPLAP